MKNRIVHIAILAGFLFLIGIGRAGAQEASRADTSSGYFQEYFSQLMEEWRLDQLQEMAKQWGVTMIGARGLKMNRSFWEKRLSLVMWLPRSSRGQSLILEYQIKGPLLIRGEVTRHFSQDMGWLDLIFRTEY